VPANLVSARRRGPIRAERIFLMMCEKDEIFVNLFGRACIYMS